MTWRLKIFLARQSEREVVAKGNFYRIVILTIKIIRLTFNNIVKRQ